MGSGEVGGGGSVRCKIDFDNAFSAVPAGKAFNERDQIGQGPGDVGKGKGHGGYFKIRFKFDNSSDRDEAYNSITKLGNDMITMFARAYADEPDQIRIDW
jgi:hypothetical protein